MLVLYKVNKVHWQMNVFTKIREVPGGISHNIKNELRKILATVYGKDSILEMMARRNVFTI